MLDFGMRCGNRAGKGRRGRDRRKGKGRGEAKDGRRRVKEGEKCPYLWRFLITMMIMIVNI